MQLVRPSTGTLRCRRITHAYSARLGISVFLVVSPALAEDYTAPTTVVSASRVPVPSPEVGSALLVLPEERIEASGARFVSDLLRQAPGVAVSRQGAVGTSAQVRMRGAEANQTLVLIDGIEANDPAFSSEFDFAYLLSGGIQTIEVLRGPQSALYGSDALGGVIHVSTQRATKPSEATAFAEAGSFNSYQAGALVGSKSDRYDLAVSAHWLDTGGTNVSRFGSEDDGYENLTVGAAGGVQLNPGLRLDASVRYTDARSEFDRQDFAFPATPTQGLVIDSDDVTDVTRLYATVQGRLDLLDGRWQHRVRASRTETQSDVFQDGLFASGNEGGGRSTTIKPPTRSSHPRSRAPSTASRWPTRGKSNLSRTVGPPPPRWKTKIGATVRTRW